MALTITRTQGVTGSVTETTDIGFVDLLAGEKLTIGGLTVTATALVPATAVAAAFANTTTGNATTGLTFSGSLVGSGFSASAVINTTHVVFTSATANTDVTDLVVNYSPVATSTTSSGNEDTVIPVDLIASDSDGSVTSFKVTSLPTNGVLYADSGLTNVLAVNSNVSLPVSQISSLTTAQIIALTPTEIAAFTTTDIVAMTATQAAALTSDQIPAIGIAQISVMPTYQLAALTTSSLVAMTNQQLDVLSPAQVTALAAAHSNFPTLTDLFPTERYNLLFNAWSPVTLPTSTKVYFKPNANSYGTTTFNYVAIDNSGVESVGATQTINVAPVADTPTIASTTSISVPEAPAMSSTGSLTIGDGDFPNDTVSVEILNVAVSGFDLGNAASLWGILNTNQSQPLNFLTFTPTQLSANGNVSWNFDISNIPAFASLLTGESLTFAYQIEAMDSDNFVTSQTLNITVQGETKIISATAIPAQLDTTDAIQVETEVGTTISLFDGQTDVTSKFNQIETVDANSGIKTIIYSAIPGNGYAGEKIITVKQSDTSSVTSLVQLIITIADGDDYFVGTTSNDTIFGMSGNDTLLGLGGSDSLDGGSGNDTLDDGDADNSNVPNQLIGGKGDDIYLVHSTGNTFNETNVGGFDTVRAYTSSFTLPRNIEHLELMGSFGYGKGNNLANSITGSAGADTLDGWLGTDTLKGGDGNDKYIIDRDTDVVVEQANQGIDTVESIVNYSLPANVENLTLTGIAAVSGTGNALANIMIGNMAANTLSGEDGADLLNGASGNDSLNGGLGADTLLGGLGVDTLTGGDGADTFQFIAADDSAIGVRRDVITDFVSGTDQISLFGSLALTGSAGTLGTAAFTAANQIRWSFYGTGVDAYAVVQGNTNADLAPEFEIKLKGVTTLAAADFVFIPSQVAVTASGTSDAAAGNMQFTFAAGNYNYSIANFGTGDILDFPAGNNPTISNTVGNDGVVDIQWAGSGQVISVTLTGLTNAQDGSIFNLSSVNTVFGVGSIV